MARLNKRSTVRQSAGRDSFDLPQSSPRVQEGVSARASTIAEAPNTSQAPRRRSRRINGTSEDEPAPAPTVRKRRRVQLKEPPVDEEEEEGPSEQLQNREGEGEDEDEDPRPSDAFLKNINEGIFGNVLPQNKQHQRPAQQPDENPQPEEEAQAAEESQGRESTPEKFLTFRAIASKYRQRSQRRLLKQPHTGEVTLAPPASKVSAIVRQREVGSSNARRSESSDLFVPSEREEDDDDDDQDGGVQTVAAQHSGTGMGPGRIGNETHIYEGQDENEEEDLDAGEEVQTGASFADPYEDIGAFLDHHCRQNSQAVQNTVKVRAGQLAYMEKAVSSKDWSGLNKDCRSILPRRENESNNSWLNRLGLRRTSRGKEVIEVIGDIQEILQDAPRIPDLDEQGDFFADNLVHLKKAMLAVQSAEEDVCDVLAFGTRGEERGGQFASAVELTRGFFIPLLVLMLGDVFRLGGACGQDGGEMDIVFAGTFTSVTLGISVHLIEGIIKLCDGLREAKAKADEPIKPVQRLRDQLVSYQRSIDDALRIIKDRDPGRLRLARERDGTARRIRQKEEQERIEERDSRFSAFIAGTQRVRQSLSSTQATQHGRAALHQLTRPRVIDLYGDGDSVSEEEEEEEEEEQDIFEDHDNQQIAEQLQLDAERAQEDARQRRIALLKEQDRRAQAMREAAARAKKEAMKKRFEVFIASTQQMHV